MIANRAVWIRVCAFSGMVMAAACGGSSGPTAPAASAAATSTVTATPTVTTWTLSGTVTETAPTASVAISGATVTIADGPDAGRTATTSSAGAFTFSGMQQAGFTVTASKSGYQPVSQGVTLDANKSVTFRLAPNGPRTQFPNGTFLVNTDIAAGRYYADPPTSGCYWERLSGLGGTLAEIIANDFLDYNAGQVIVDIASSDRAFSGDADCGTWYATPRAGVQSSVGPGFWLVGTQVAAGTYRTTASAGCYWERLRNFSGSLSAIISNNFVSSGGSQLVTIAAGDVGFSTDGDCGTWSPVSAAVGSVEEAVTADAIARNRDRQRGGRRPR